MEEHWYPHPLPLPTVGGDKKSQCACLHLYADMAASLQFPDLTLNNDSLLVSGGMMPQELSRLLYSKDKHCEPIRKRAQRDLTNETLGEVTSRKITKEDVCPICLEILLEKKSPVTHCRYGCGQAVHIHCMKVMARHQMDGVLEKNIGHIMLFCPLCSKADSTLNSRRTYESGQLQLCGWLDPCAVIYVKTGNARGTMTAIC
ncbi:unnamed protein product [Timema podura]|uniref:Uncharacterized protein n=1 Tax=Timema podura TaxID=61482 RepID=A0ABN7P2J4_TIMPD|nr:unnamed protein product [Timema podura]